MLVCAKHIAAMNAVNGRENILIILVVRSAAENRLGRWKVATHQFAGAEYIRN